MLVSFDLRFQFLLVLIFYSRLLVDNRAVASAIGSSHSLAYIANSSTDLLLSGYARNAVSSSSVRQLHDSSNLQATSMLSSTFSPGGNSTVFAYVESADNYQSATPGSISKTSKVRNAERSISMNGSISTEHSRTFQNVSTTPVAELRSSGIVTAPISSAVSANYTSVKSSQTAVPELLSSKHEHQSNETSMKTLSSNSTAIFLLFNGTLIAKDASSNFSISKTSEYVRRTTEVSPSVPSVVSPPANKTTIHYTTVSPRGNIQWTNISANLSGYEGSVGLNRSRNRTAVMSYITASPHPSTSKSSSSSRIDMVNKSENSPASSTVLLLLNTTQGVRSINVTVVSLSKNLNSSSGTIPNSSSIQWKAEEIISSTSTSTRLSSTLLPSQLNNNKTSRVRSGVSKFGNISATVSVIPASSTRELNSSHDEHCGINTSHSSYIIPAQSGILLNISSRTRQELKTKVYLSSSSMPVPSLNTDVWNVSSAKEQHLAASSRNDMFGNSTIAIGSGATSVSRYLNKTSAIGHTADVYSTSLLPTLTLFTEQIIRNTTSTSLSKGNHTATLMFSKSIRSMAANMSSVDSIEKTTTNWKVNSSSQFLNGISPSHNSTLNIKPFTSLASERQKTEKKSKELLTGSHNISSSIVVFNLPPSVVWTTVSSPLKYSTTHASWSVPFLPKVLSTSVSSSIATSKADIPFGRKSSVQINSSQSPASSRFDLPTEGHSNINAVINSTNQVYYGSSTIQSSSDLFVYSTAEVTNRSFPIVQPSSSLPVLTNSSNMIRVSVVPIYTPCYISYMVTVSRIVTHSFVASTVDIETGATSSVQQPSFPSHSNDQSHAGSTPLQPTPSTRFFAQHSSTEMFSKSPTESLSRLPGHVESSMQTKHDAAMTKSNTRSATMNKPNYTQAHNFTKSDNSISNVAVSSSVLHELTVNRNLTAGIRNHTTLLIDHSRSTSVQNFPVKISKSLNTFPLPNKSTSIVDKYVNFNVSITTTTTTTVMNLTSPILNVRMSSNAPAKSELAYTSMIENATTLGHSVRSGSNSVNKSSHQSSNISSRSVLRQETSLVATTTSPLFTKHITLHPTQSSSVQLGIALSTVSAKQVHQTVSPIVNISDVQSSISFYNSSFSNLSRNVTTSQDAHATPSLNHMFSNRSNPTVTAYFNRHDTSVPLSYSRFSFNLTNVRIYGTTLSTLATVTNRRTTAQSTRTENRNLPQPTPVLSRTPSLNNLSVVLSSSIPMLTSKESLLNQNTSAKSTLRNVSGFVNSTLILLSSSTESNMSIFSYKPTVESTSSLDVPSLSNRTTVGLNSNSGGNKTMLVTPSIPVVSRHTRNATHGQNVLPIVSATISKENIQFISIEVIRASSIWPTVVLATGSNLNSQWTSYKNDHTSNSFPDKTISYSSFHVTPSISSSGKPETNPLRRKRRELRNLTVMQDNIGTNSTKNVIKNATTTSTVNISILLLNTSSWKMKEESVELRSTERFLPTQTGSLHQTVKTRFTPTPVINASKATPSPVLVTTSSLEKRFMTSSWNLSFSRLANESRSLTNGYNSLSVPILSPSVEIDHSAASMVSPKRTSSAITSTVRNSSLVETFLSPNNSSIVSSTTNSVNEDRRLMTASASQLASSQGMNTEQYNTSITNGTNSDRNSRLSNRSSLILLTPTITQKQRIMITQSTSIHQSVALTPSITIYKKSVSSNLKMSAKQAVMSTSLDVGMISNSSIINYSSLISTAKSISSPNITLSMTQGKYEKKVNASESTLNTSMTASLNIGSGTYPPTIQDSSYISTTQYTSSSNRTSFSSQLRHETNIQVSKSLVNTGILESTMMSRTQLLVKSLLYSLTYARMNVTTTNNTIRTESNVTAVKSTNSVFPPTSIDDENSRNTSQMRISHSSTSLRLVLETSVGNESLALMPSPVTTLHTSVTAEKLSLYQSENMYSVVNSSPRMMLSSAGTFKFSHHSFISVSSSPTSSFHNSSSDNIRTTSLVKSTLSRAITNGLIPQSSENVTSSISPASVSAHSHNVTSLIHGNISDASSTVSTSYISVTQSPSPSFSIIGSKGITATPTLSKESYISSAAILSQSSSLTTTDGKDHFVANSSVTLPGESSSILSRILRTESRSKVIVITSEKQSGGYYLIPTSSLGLCLVSYSTIFVNISVKTPVTLNTTPVNTTSSLQTPLSMPSSGEINSTRIFTSSVVLRSNVRTSGVLKPSLVSSLVVNKSSISVNYSGVILSTSPFKTSYSGMNTTSLGQYLSKSAGNTTIFQSSTMAYSKPLPITSQTDIPVLPSPTLPKATATYTSKTYTSKTYTVINISPNMSLTSSLYQISPTVSSIVQSSSVATTHTPTSTVDENSILVIALKVPESTNVSTIAFKAILEEKLYQIYQKGLLVQRKRRKRSTLPDSRVEVQNIQRNGQEVDVKYIVIASNRTLLAEDAAKIMDVFTVQKMSSIIGYEVLSRPRPVKTIVPGSPVLAMLVKTTSQNNLSNAAIKKEFEVELARFYRNSEKLPVTKTVNATITKIFHDPLGRTYIEFIITVDNVAVDRTTVMKSFASGAILSSKGLNQMVLVAPYIPGMLQPSEMDYIIQNMQFNNVTNLEAIKNEISNKLTQVYVKALLSGVQKRRKRALGSIDAVLTGTSWTQGISADVTYYITDAGSIFNATYACSILKRLTLVEMSSITAPYTVNSTPRPRTPTTSGTSANDDDYPSWFIPVVIAGSVGFLLLVLIIILYCRWKKGAPPKKIQPQAGSPIEEEVHKPRMTHAAEPEARPTLRRPPPTPTRPTVSVEENGHSEPRPKAAPRAPARKLPVREGSVRKKVTSRESIITRTNPAYDPEEDSVDESVTDVRVPRSRRPETKVVVEGRTELEIPARAIPPQSVKKSLLSDAQDESDESEGESVITAKDSVFTENTNEYSAGTLPPIAVMSDPRPPEIQPPPIFRNTVHPGPSLPPLDPKQTSLIGRVVEEEGSVQKEMKTKADIERWRNKQRQREKRLGDSPSKSGNKRPSFTEKKAWGRAQQEIGAVLDPEAMQPVVRKPRRKRRKYKVRAETSDDEGNVELRGFRKITSPREEKMPKVEQESDSDVSMGEARRRLIGLIDDAFTSIKSASKKHHPETTDHVDAGEKPQRYPQSKHPPPLYPRPATLAPALPEPPPSHGRASVPSARHRRRFMNSQNLFPYPSQYYPGMSGSFSPRYPPPPPPPVVTRNPLIVWDPVDKQRTLTQTAYRSYGGHPYSYSDPSGKLHFTPVQQTPDGMGGLVWSPYATEYAMEDFYRNVEMPGTLDSKNSSFLSKMPETPLGTMPESTGVPRDAVIDMPDAGERGTTTGESAEPLVHAIKDELFRLASGRTPVKHM